MQRDAVPMCSNASMRARAWRTHPPPCPKPQSLLTQHPAHSGAPCAQHNTLWVATTSPSVNQWRLPTEPPAAVTSPECKVFPGGGGCCCGYWGVRGAHEQELLLLGVRGACEEGASMCPRRAASLSTGLDEVREVSAFCAHCTQACIFIFAHTHTRMLSHALTPTRTRLPLPHAASRRRASIGSGRGRNHSGLGAPSCREAVLLEPACSTPGIPPLCDYKVRPWAGFAWCERPAGC